LNNLEHKGKRTIKSIKKSLIALVESKSEVRKGKLTDLENTEEVELAIARYKKKIRTKEEWIVEGTTDKKRATELLAADFTYQLTTPDGTMLFKKASNLCYANQDVGDCDNCQFEVKGARTLPYSPDFLV
jgi:hypothetical protein